MAPDPKTYDELAQNVLRDFLRSAVIIDDQWPEALADEADLNEPDESALIDDGVPEKKPDATGALDVEESERDVLPARPSGNPEDARLLADLQRALLQEGLLACGYRYTHQTRDIAINLASRADIVVLDWHLVNDEGAEALAILKELQGNELRFVCIFTGHGRILEVRKALEGHLGKASRETEDGMMPDLRIGNLVLAIRNKKGIGEESPLFTVEPKEMLAAALQGLARNYNGLVQLAMLELTQQHRRQLPAILERIDQSIDTAVLLEAGDESSPVGQGGSFLAVLIDEWRAHLEQEQSEFRVLSPGGRRLFGALLAERLGEIPEEIVEQALQETGVRVAKALAKQEVRSQLQEWLVGGCTGAGLDVQGVELSKKQRPLAGWGVLQATSGTVKEESALPLLRLDALFHQQFEQPEKLTQGTIVAVHHSESEPHYYLCVTPACDAAQPYKIANLFTFLRTECILPESLFTNKDKKADYCVVEDEKRLLCLKILVKQRVSMEVGDRAFDNSGVVLGRLTLGDNKSSMPVSLRRTAQLRAEYALSITAAAAADAIRVGLNRVELVRSRLE